MMLDAGQRLVKHVAELDGWATSARAAPAAVGPVVGCL